MNKKSGGSKIVVLSSQTRRGQVKMSFGMIFSIILIIAFIGFAIFGIHKFLSLQSSVTSQQFVSNLQSDVKTVWDSAQASTPETYNVPSSLKQVCFSNSKSDNMVLWGENNPIESANIEHLNISYMTRNGDLCFNSTQGKISLTLEMKLGNTLVTIK